MAQPDVVLVDPHDMPLSTAPKATVHTRDTPLHQAFSCHLVGSDGRVLLTRRAITKLTWPGVWTNAFCGHPGPRETRVEALVRHARTELGIVVDPHRVELAIGDFAYRAADASGIVENEICPVYRLHADPDLQPDSAEVMDHAWVEPESLDAIVAGTAWLISPWAALQWAELRGLPRPVVRDAQRL